MFITNKANILIIDKDPLYALMLGYFLPQYHFINAQHVSDGERYLLKNDAIKIIIFSLDIGTVPFLALQKTINSLALDIKIILMLDPNNNDPLIKTTSFNADAYILKPVDIDLLRGIIPKCLLSMQAGNYIH